METPPKRYVPCPFLRRRGWRAKENQCDFLYPKPVHHNYHTATLYSFPHGDGFPPIGNLYIPRNALYHELYNRAPSYSSPFFIPSPKTDDFSTSYGYSSTPPPMSLLTPLMIHQRDLSRHQVMNSLPLKLILNPQKCPSSLNTIEQHF